MKTLLSLLAALIGLAVVPSTASARDHRRGQNHSHSYRSYRSHYDAPRYSAPAGYFVTRFVGYDECGRPVYRRVWVSAFTPGRSYYGYNQGRICR